MKVLFDLYCNSSIHSAYLQSYRTNSQRRTEYSKNSLPSGSGPLAPPSGGICDGFGRLTLKKKQRAYQRFYQALTAHWVAVEFSWEAKIRVYKTAADCKQFSEQVRGMWTCNHDRTLQEKLDIIEIIDFV
jgi:hypothetical protein